MQKRQNQVNKNKERAFVELASKTLKWSDEKKAIYLELVEDGLQLSGNLWEKIISKLAKTKIVDARGSDFADLSEAKTGITRKYSCGGRGMVTNMGGKFGWIRVAIYNECKDSIDFFLLPPKHLVKVYYTKYNGSKGHSSYSYGITNDNYGNNMQKYRVKNVKAVCARELD
jgi:hypothetical protein